MQISFAQEQKFERFLELFVEYNSHTNLSAIREKEDIIVKHFVDSALLLEFMSLSGCTVLDIGTGGGFPGIPLAILSPDTFFTLMDSVGKKTKACIHFRDAL